MKIVTIAVPEEEMLAFDTFLQQSNVIVLDEKSSMVFESEEITITDHPDANLLKAMEQIEKELDEEIWKLHHFTE